MSGVGRRRLYGFPLRRVLVRGRAPWVTSPVFGHGFGHISQGVRLSASEPGGGKRSESAVVRRTYASPTGGGPRDRDTFQDVARFRVFGWSLVGAFLGFLLGVFLRVQSGAGVIVVVATTLIGWVASYIVPLVLLAGAGRAGSSLYAPSGSSTPHKREYSQAETFAARGEYEMAVAAFEAAIAEGPGDPVPYLHVARLQRDRLKDDQAAARWFKRCLGEATMNAGQRLLTLRELVELYETRIGTPEQVAPLLARIAAERPDERDGQWAAEALSEIKRRMRGEGDPGSE